MIGFLALFIITFVHIYTIVLISYAWMSWFPGAQHSPLGKWLESASRPYLNLFRSLPLQLGPFDLTVYVAVLVLQAAGQVLLAVL